MADFFGGFGGYRYPPRPRYRSFSNINDDLKSLPFRDIMDAEPL